MQVTLYKVCLKGIWDSKINDSFRNILKSNGFILKNDNDNFNYEWSDFGGYPEGHDYNSWYANNGYKTYTYADYPVWVPSNNKETQLLLTPEDFATIMFVNETLEDKIKFESVSKSLIEIEHPMESMIKELSKVFTNGFSNAITKQLMKQRTGDK